MMPLRFEVPGPPVPAARPRAVPLMRKGRAVLDGNGRPIIRMHTEQATIDYEALVATRARLVAGAFRWRKPEKGRRLGIRILVYRTKRTGDWDNFAKAICDGITKSGAVWEDDRYVVSASVAMAVSKDRPRVVVEVMLLDKED